MLAVCHGRAEGGATHVPVALQDHIEQIATSIDNTCVLLDSGTVSCWGSTLSAVNDPCLDSTIESIYTWDQGGESHAAALCSSQHLVRWNGTKNQNITTISGVSNVSRAPTNVCYVRGTLGSCTNFALGLIGPVDRVFAGDQGACYKPEGIDILTCIGRYAGSTITYDPDSLLDVKLAGGVMCAQYTNGWQCQTATSVTNADASAARNLSEIWNLVGTSPQSHVPLGPLDMYAEWGSASGALCAVRTETNQIWCQGTGFSVGGDVQDGIFNLNVEDTADSQAVSVAKTHACVLISTPSSNWAWVIFGLILLLAVIALIFGIYEYRVRIKAKYALKTLY